MQDVRLGFLFLLLFLFLHVSYPLVDQVPAEQQQVYSLKHLVELSMPIAVTLQDIADILVSVMVSER